MRDGRLGSYRVVSCIGEGGMGTVYRAEHVLLGRAAAVKVLQPELSQHQDMVDRFFNEARATAQLRHPGIVEVFDFGYAEDGAAYIVMELLHGESLTSRLAREGRLPWPRACAFARQIASSLAAAHRARIVHRDLKPDNVHLVLEPDQREERTKVLDFGIAKLADPGSSSSVKTRVDLIIGTPAYMSPQQCRGAGQVDHRADIYSLGCILFEMVCGRPPFEGEGMGDLLGAHMLLPPPRPRALAPELPESLEGLILRMLAKAEADRPQSMEAVAAELDAIVEASGAVAASSPPASAPAATAVSSTRTSPTRRLSTRPPARTSSMEGPGTDGAAPRAVTTCGGSAGQAVTFATSPQRRRSSYAFACAAVVVAVAIAAAPAMVHRTDPAGAAAAAAAIEERAPAEARPSAPAPPRRPRISGIRQVPVEPVGSAPRASGGPPRTGAAPVPGPGSVGGERGERGGPDDALAALLAAWRSWPWFDPTAIDDWLTSSLGPEVTLTVATSPPGAEVALDGRLLGRTPLSLTVDRGMYDFTLVLTLARHGERELAMSAAMDRTEHVVLPPLVTRRVLSTPPGAELVSGGEVLGTTPLELELPRSEEAESFTLRLAGYLEQAIEIVPDQSGSTAVALEREPQLITHELGCDPACEIVLGGEVIGRAAPGSSYRGELLEQKGQWRTYVLRPLDGHYLPVSFRAAADRPVATTIRLPCAPRARSDAAVGPRVSHVYNRCRWR